MYPVSACLLQNMCIYHSTYVARAEREREREREENKKKRPIKRREAVSKRRRRERERESQLKSVQMLPDAMLHTRGMHVTGIPSNISTVLLVSNY
jgi:hypothetical protein